MPGARAIGYLAKRPMTSVASAAEIQVATKTDPGSIPVEERIAG